MVAGTCRLCGLHGELKASHIFPRFVFQWMRETGGGQYFRSTDKPGVREQDGPKEHLLCGGCEQRFSRGEAYFKREVFDPYIARKATSIPYDSRLFYFIKSVAWRTLIRDFGHKDIGQHRFIKQLRQAEAEWRNFLLTDSLPTTFNEAHLFLSDVISCGSMPVDRMSLYFARAVDGTIVSSDSGCSIYWKFARFMSFSAITPFNQSLWIGTRISPSGGTLAVPQEIQDGVIGEFLVHRARIAARARASDPLTERQKQFHIQRIKQNPSAFLGSDLAKVIKADMSSEVDPRLLYKKIGRNAPCPCGSGKKYKRCHGQ